MIRSKHDQPSSEIGQTSGEPVNWLSRTGTPGIKKAHETAPSGLPGEIGQKWLSDKSREIIEAGKAR